MSAYMHGHAVGANMALYGAAEPSAVSIPPEYLGSNGELPKAWDGWTVAAHEYAEGVGAGHARIVKEGKFGVAAPDWSQVPGKA